MYKHKCKPDGQRTAFVIIVSCIHHCVLIAYGNVLGQNSIKFTALPHVYFLCISAMQQPNQ